MEEREKDIQELCRQVLELELEDTGDYSTGWCCPICKSEKYKGKWKDANMANTEHDSNCAYLIAKDLSAGVKQQNK